MAKLRLRFAVFGPTPLLGLGDPFSGVRTQHTLLKWYTLFPGYYCRGAGYK